MSEINYRRKRKTMRRKKIPNIISDTYLEYFKVISTLSGEFDRIKKVEREVRKIKKSITLKTLQKKSLIKVLQKETDKRMVSLEDKLKKFMLHKDVIKGLKIFDYVINKFPLIKGAKQFCLGAVSQIPVLGSLLNGVNKMQESITSDDKIKIYKQVCLGLISIISFVHDMIKLIPGTEKLNQIGLVKNINKNLQYVNKEIAKYFKPISSIIKRTFKLINELESIKTVIAKSKTIFTKLAKKYFNKLSKELSSIKEMGKYGNVMKVAVKALETVFNFGLKAAKKVQATRVKAGK